MATILARTWSTLSASPARMSSLPAKSLSMWRNVCSIPVNPSFNLAAQLRQ